MTQFVQCKSVPCLLPEEMARDVDALYKTLPQGCDFVRKAYTSDYQFEPGERAEVSIITSEVVDLSNEVVLVKGLDLDKYRRHGVVLWNHDMNSPPVGECKWIKAYNGDQIRAKTYYPERVEQRDQPWFIDQIWDLVSSMVLRCKSIGFLPRTPKREPTAAELAEHPEWAGAGIWDDGIVYEYSLVPTGCNQEALIQVVQRKSLDMALAREFAAVAGIELPPQQVIEVPAAPVPEPIPVASEPVQKARYTLEEAVARALAVAKPLKRKRAPDPEKVAEKLARVINPSVERIVRQALDLYQSRGRA